MRRCVVAKLQIIACVQKVVQPQERPEQADSEPAIEDRAVEVSSDVQKVTHVPEYSAEGQVIS